MGTAIKNGIAITRLNPKSGGNQEHPYLSLERLREYLYRVTFDSLPEDNGGDNPVVGGCSSYVAGGKLHRNLDFNYDNAASFIVRTRKFEGMSFMTGLNDGRMDDGKIAQLPYRIVDGCSNHGIMVSTHVLFNDWQWTGAGAKNISLTRLPFEVLSRVRSMDTIATDLDGILDNLYASEGLLATGYLIQLLVTDGTTSYAILPPASEGEAFVLQNITSNPKLTNFRWMAQPEVSRYDMDMQDRPTGIERWNMMPCALKDLRFTKAYETTDRLSEFIGIRETTKASTDAELEAIYNDARALYLDRERDGQTWQTMHSVVYGNGIEHLWIQENWNDDCIASAASAAAALITHSESDVTVEGFSVPALTAGQVIAAYNAVVAGRGCIVVDKDDVGHFFVNQADSLNGDITVEILFYSYMLVAYTLSGDTFP